MPDWPIRGTFENKFAYESRVIDRFRVSLTGPGFLSQALVDHSIWYMVSTRYIHIGPRVFLQMLPR